MFKSWPDLTNFETIIIYICLAIGVLTGLIFKRRKK
jgi:hypothetical protein